MLRVILVPSQKKSKSLPPGGTTGQVLIKASDEDGDVTWSSDAPVVTESELNESSMRPVNSQAVSEVIKWNRVN